mmetsp:Transcript_47482/g.132382  ORF Transcript_47482/g.132382 Transcript_47482/m.132382 type:complete len:312 (+) Transcript_47482:831-1766(+)
MLSRTRRLRSSHLACAGCECLPSGLCERILRCRSRGPGSIPFGGGVNQGRRQRCLGRQQCACGHAPFLAGGLDPRTLLFEAGAALAQFLPLVAQPRGELPRSVGLLHPIGPQPVRRARLLCGLHPRRPHSRGRLRGLRGLCQRLALPSTSVLQGTPLAVECLQPSCRLVYRGLRGVDVRAKAGGRRIRLPQLRREGEADETGGVLVTARERAAATHLVAVECDGVEAMFPAHLVAQLKGRANNRFAEDLAHCRQRPVLGVDHLDEGLHALNLRVLPVLLRDLVQRRADDVAEVALPHERNDLPGDVVVRDE